MRFSSLPSICEVCKCAKWSNVFISLRRHNTKAQKRYGKTVPPEELLKIALNPYVPKSAKELVEKLSKEIVFYKPGDVLVINKPYGVSCLGRRLTTRGIFKNNLEQFDPEEKMDSSITLDDALPLLGDQFKESGLHFCIGLKRYTSGPVVLPCSKQAFNKIKNSVVQATNLTSEDFYMYKALAICLEKPEKSSGRICGYATYEDSRDSKEFVFVPDAVARFHDRASNKKIQGEMFYNVLATKHGLSLVDLHFSKFNRHLPRLMMSHLGTPIFGDKLYEKRLLQIGDELACVNPKDLWRLKEGGTQYVPNEFLELIGRQDYAKLKPQIPMFFAVYESTFPRFGSKKDSNTGLILRTPPPGYFYAMSKLLGFDSSIKTLMNLLGNQTEYEAINVYGGDE